MILWYKKLQAEAWKKIHQGCRISNEVVLFVFFGLVFLLFFHFFLYFGFLGIFAFFLLCEAPCFCLIF